MALTICGTTVSSYPTMPGKIGLPSRSRDIRFSRSSSFTRRDWRCCAVKGLWRNSPRVRAKLMVGTPKGNDLKRIIPLRRRCQRSAISLQVNRFLADSQKLALWQVFLSELGDEPHGYQ